MKFFSILREIIRDTVFFFLSRISFELKNIFRTKIHGQVRREEFPRIVEARLEKYPIYTHALSRN